MRTKRRKPLRRICVKILVIDGPNMNMLGIREPQIYGTLTYDELVSKVKLHALSRGVIVKTFQSNHEGAIVDEIQNAIGEFDGIVINPAAYTHTSVAIRDALAAVSLPAAEVHISEVGSREEFRKVNFVRDLCFFSVSGKGADGYLEALDAVIERLSQ